MRPGYFRFSSAEQTRAGQLRDTRRLTGTDNTGDDHGLEEMPALVFVAVALSALSQWSQMFQYTGSPEPGLVGASCSTSASDVRDSTIELEVGTVQLHDGKGEIQIADDIARPEWLHAVEWEVNLKRVDWFGGGGRFLLVVVEADHKLGNGGGDSAAPKRATCSSRCTACGTSSLPYPNND